MQNKPILASAAVLIAAGVAVGVLSHRSVALNFASTELRRAELLSTRIPELRAGDCSLADAFEQLSKITGTRIAADDRVLNGAGQSASTLRVEQMLFDVSLEQALSVLLRNVAGDHAPLTWTWRKDDIVITTVDEASTETYLQTYDVADLLTVIDSHYRPLPATPSFSLFEPASSAMGTDQGANSCIATREEVEEMLVTLIEETVWRESWVSGGGMSGNLWVAGDTLLVVQTRQAHDEVAQLLQKLRSSPSFE